MAVAFMIRRAQASDAENLSDFAARLFRSTYGSDTAASDLEDYITKNFGPGVQAAEIDNPDGAIFLATAEDAIIGYAHMTSGPDRFAHLNRIYIEAGWRGSGLANELLEAVVGQAARSGFTRLGLTVFERNMRAMAFYRKSGFMPTGHTIFTLGEDAQTDVLMELDLSGR